MTAPGSFMARSSTDLPRMQNQSRARAPFGRNLDVLSQVIDTASKTPSQVKPAMMRQYDLIERVKRYNPATSEPLLNRAYVYAMRAHGEQKRASGGTVDADDTEVTGDRMTEEELLKGLEGLTPPEEQAEDEE